MHVCCYWACLCSLFVRKSDLRLNCSLRKMLEWDTRCTRTIYIFFFCSIYRAMKNEICLTLIYHFLKNFFISLLDDQLVCLFLGLGHWFARKLILLGQKFLRVHKKNLNCEMEGRQWTLPIQYRNMSDSKSGRREPQAWKGRGLNPGLNCLF